jgi:hypothetical protein
MLEELERENYYICLSTIDYRLNKELCSVLTVSTDATVTTDVFGKQLCLD